MGRHGTLPGEGKIRNRQLWHGNIWRNKSVQILPQYLRSEAIVVGLIVSSLGMHISIVPHSPGDTANHPSSYPEAPEK